MAANLFHSYFGRLLLVACIAVAGLIAAEHHGVVKSGGLPVPGATVTATQGDKKVVTTTDERGAYQFADLADGVWTIHVEMLGFEKVSRDIGVAPDAAGPSWELKMMTMEAITAPPPAAAAPVAAAPAEKPVETKPAETKTAETKPVETKAADTKPADTKAATAATKPPAKGAKGKTPATPAANTSGNPSLAAAMGGRTSAPVGGRGGQGGFQRVGVNQSGDTPVVAAAPGMSADMMNNSDLAQSANDSFMVNGS